MWQAESMPAFTVLTFHVIVFLNLNQFIQFFLTDPAICSFLRNLISYACKLIFFLDLYLALIAFPSFTSTNEFV